MFLRQKGVHFFNEQQLRETKFSTNSCIVSNALDILFLKFQTITSTSVAAHTVVTHCVNYFLLVIILFFSLWQQAALVLNASRRFRYTLDLKKEEEKEHIRRKIRAHAQVIRVYFLSYLPAMHFYIILHFSCLMDWSLNAIRPLCFSKRLGKSRMVIQNYQVTALDNGCLLV